MVVSRREDMRYKLEMSESNKNKNLTVTENMRQKSKGALFSSKVLNRKNSL